MGVVTASEWDAFLQHQPDVHLLQTSAWGKLKSKFGWEPVYLIKGGCGAMLLFRRLPLGLRVAYMPKGPVGCGNINDLLPELHEVCKRRGAIFLKVEPDAWEGDANIGDSMLQGWVPTRPVQPQRTVIIPLSGSDEELLDRMKQKTRYNVRLAMRKGISVVESDDVETFHRLMLITGRRDGFGVHSLEYYQTAFGVFDVDSRVLLMALFDNRPVAGLMAFANQTTAWYFYGASSDEERNRMPTYLLQYEAMLWAKRKGCQWYDMWGIPDVDETQLENEFLDHHDGLWGVYRFKRGFGGDVKRSVGAFDFVYQPLLYRAYRWYAGRRGGNEAAG